MKRLYAFTLAVALLLSYTASSISQTYWKLQTNPVGAPCGRLTLTTGVPLTTSDVTGATTVFYTPYVCDTIPLWDGTIWQSVTFTQTSVNLGTLTSGKPYDVFAFISSATLALEILAWTNDTTRATAVTYTDGRVTKSGDKTRLLLGTFYTTSTTQTEDSEAKRYLSNMYHREPRPMKQGTPETTDSWAYTLLTWRQARATSTNQLDYVATYADVYANAFVQVIVNGSATGAASVGVGVNSTSTNSAKIWGANSTNSPAGAATNPHSSWAGYGIAGKNYLAWLEIAVASGTVTWYGDAGNNTAYQSGIYGTVWN